MCLLLMWPSCVHVLASLCIGGCKKAGAPGFMPCHHWLVCAAANGILARWATFLCEGSRPRFLRWCLQSQICSYFRITAGFDFNVNFVDRIVLVLLGYKNPGRFLLVSSCRGCGRVDDHPQLVLHVDALADNFPSTVPFKDRASVFQGWNVFVLFTVSTPTCGHEMLAGLILRIGSALEQRTEQEILRKTLCISKNDSFRTLFTTACRLLLGSETTKKHSDQYGPGGPRCGVLQAGGSGEAAGAARPAPHRHLNFSPDPQHQHDRPAHFWTEGAGSASVTHGGAESCSSTSRRTTTTEAPCAHPGVVFG